MWNLGGQRKTWEKIFLIFVLKIEFKSKGFFKFCKVNSDSAIILPIHDKKIDRQLCYESYRLFISINLLNSSYDKSLFNLFLRMQT